MNRERNRWRKPSHCVAALGAVAGRDWTTVRAGRLDWSCRDTAVHVAGDLISYAGQLAGRAQDAYVPFDITLDGGGDGLDPADNGGVLQVIATTGALLAAAVRTTPAPCAPSTRIPSGTRTARVSPRWVWPRCCCTPTTWPRGWAWRTNRPPDSARSC